MWGLSRARLFSLCSALEAPAMWDGTLSPAEFLNPSFSCRIWKHTFFFFFLKLYSSIAVLLEHHRFPGMRFNVGRTKKTTELSDTHAHDQPLQLEELCSTKEHFLQGCLIVNPELAWASKTFVAAAPYISQTLPTGALCGHQCWKVRQLLCDVNVFGLCS